MNEKKVLIGVSVGLGAILIVLVLVLGYFRGWFGGTGEKTINIPGGNSNKTAGENVVSTTMNVNFSDSQITTAFDAINNLDQQACAEIRDDEVADGCYREVAIALKNSQICASITSMETKVSCFDAINLPRVIESGKIEWCESQIQGPGKKKICLREFIGSGGYLDWCNALSGDLKIYCQSIVIFNQAVNQKDNKLCVNIGDADYEKRCEFFTSLSDEEEITKNVNSTPEPDLSTVDSDGDGLSDADEIKYKTDPNNPDTDGDGYKDGEEVHNGYNPLGAGKLNQ